MKTDDVVKEKAMVKLKEVKLKAEDTGSGSKAMQFLEGLLKIPFGIYKEEQILRVMPEIISSFNELIKNINKSSVHVRSHIEIPFPNKMTYTSLEIYKYLALLNNNYKPAIKKNSLYASNSLGFDLSKLIAGLHTNKDIITIFLFGLLVILLLQLFSK
jgi:hypothetical protein